MFWGFFAGKLLLPTLINHTTSHSSQTIKVWRGNNYQIVALTTLGSFLAHEVAQYLILKHLNVEKKSDQTDDYHYAQWGNIVLTLYIEYEYVIYPYSEVCHPALCRN